MELIKPVSQQNSRSSVADVAPTIAARLAETQGPTEAEKEEASLKKERLFSLDFLRGADIFFLTVVCGIVYTFDKHCHFPEWVMKQFDHPEWVGFSVLDMVMPLFIFMCGAALPLALDRRLDKYGHAGLNYWGHVLSRVAMLWVFGMIAQGELFSFDIHRISFFNNTLQTIACGYLVTAIVSRIKSYKVQVAIPFILAAGYTVFLHALCDWTPSGNAAVVYEVKFLSLFYPGPDAANVWHPVSQIHKWHYTWWTTIPMFGVMGLAGYHATKVLLNFEWSKKKRFAVQAAVGAGLVVLGLGLMTFDPCIKHIFTASFTSIAMGVSFLLYAGCYYVFDIVKFRFGTWLIMLFGRHSLVAYMFADTILGSAVWALAHVFVSNKGEALKAGFSQFLPDQASYDIVFAFVKAAILVAILCLFDRRGKKQAPADSRAIIEEKIAEIEANSKLGKK